MLDKEFCELVEMNVHLKVYLVWWSIQHFTPVREMIQIFMAIIRNSSYILHSFRVTYCVENENKKFYRN